MWRNVGGHQGLVTFRIKVKGLLYRDLQRGDGESIPQREELVSRSLNIPLVRTHRGIGGVKREKVLQCPYLLRMLSACGTWTLS